MPAQNDVQEFPDLSNKLTAPSKKSLFERQRAEADAKRAREEAETAAVYEDFVKSFEDEDANGFRSSTNAGDRFGSDSVPSRLPGGPGKRHFAPGGGRGASGPGSLGPPPSLSRKRPFEQVKPSDRDRDRERDSRLFAFNDTPSNALAETAAAFASAVDHDEDTADGRAAERAAAKPTLQLSCLPPGTSSAVVKSLLPSNVTVDGIRFVNPTTISSGASAERRSISAIVTLAKDTPASELDTAVNTLQGRYLGYGFYLSLSRHLSSAALHALPSATQSLHSITALPFNARPITNTLPQSLNRAPPPGMHRGGFAPPSSYGPTPGRGAPTAQVHVTAPTDIKQLRLIHKTVESVLTHGPPFEALLMTRPEVQRDERWAWLWDSRSSGGVWYRWQLWRILSGAAARRTPRTNQLDPPTHRLFDASAPWMEPVDEPPFEFATRFAALVSDSDYNSSDEDDSDAEAGEHAKRRRVHDSYAAGGQGGAAAAAAPADADPTYLKPLHRAKLTHLLARLPPTAARLRKGDVARVTAFAIAHAGAGADEVVDMLVANVLRPVACCRAANPELAAVAAATTTTTTTTSTVGVDGSSIVALAVSTTAPGDAADKKEDTSPASLVALYLLSDILSASSTSGVRHAWRYRALIEAALSARRVFSRLGRFERVWSWGRLRADKWRRSVSGVLALWEGWCVFSGAAQEGFVAEFERAAVGERELEDKAETVTERDVPEALVGKSKWKSVDGRRKEEGSAVMPVAVADDVDGEPMVEGEEADLDGEPMEEEDLDGEPMESDMDGEPMDASDDATEPLPPGPEASTPLEPARAEPPAEDKDMFADSDGE